VLCNPGMLRLAALAVLLAIPQGALADPKFAVGLDYTFGHGGHVEDLDLNMRFEPGLFLRIDRWHATVSFPVQPSVRSANPERDTAELTGFGVSGRLAYRMPMFGGALSIGGGITRRWLFAQTDVTRSCRETGTCVAGTYVETPTYHAWAPQLRIGIGPDKQWPSLVMTATFELIVEAISFKDVPPDGIRDIAIMGGVTFTIGGGPRR
jgi:hypothetical protein